MSKFSTSVFALAVILASAATVATASRSDAAGIDPDVQPFLGFWEGVDPLDGSVVQSSITDIDKDGVIEVYQREGFFSVCYNGTTNTKGGGLFEGTGTVTKRRVMVVDLQRICVNDDGSTEPPVPLTRKYLLRSKGEVLHLKFTHEILLHKTSN